MRTDRTLRRNLDRLASGKTGPDMADPPKRSIARQIRHPQKKAFDYGVIMDEGSAYFAVSGTMTSDRAAEMFRKFRPEADPLKVYRHTWCRFNVSNKRYELCEEQPGAFPVHAFLMEE